LGTGLWIGQEFYKSNQEISFPFGMGLIMNGKLLPSVRMDAATGK
jgi:branched-chain amino acid transport system substrate-binding protein